MVVITATMYGKNTDNIIFFQICVMFFRWHIMTRKCVPRYTAVSILHSILIDTSTPKIDILSLVAVIIPVTYDNIIFLNNEISRLVVLQISLVFRRYMYFENYFWSLYIWRVSCYSIMLNVLNQFWLVFCNVYLYLAYIHD